MNSLTTFPKRRASDSYLNKQPSNLQKVGGVLRVLRFSPPVKLTATI